jgi:hypothetical protein
VGIITTFLAIKLAKGTRPGYGEYFGNVRLGFWLAVAGLALAGVGAAIGYRPRRG